MPIQNRALYTINNHIKHKHVVREYKTQIKERVVDDYALSFNLALAFGYGLGYSPSYHANLPPPRIEKIETRISEEPISSSTTLYLSNYRKVKQRSNVAALVLKLKRSIKAKNRLAIAALLKSDFILKALDEEITEHNQRMSKRIEIEDDYTYQVCKVRPSIEHLICSHNRIFRKLFQLAETIDHEDPSAELRYTIVQQLDHLDLYKADLRDLNLQGANLSYTKLRKTQLANTNFMDAVCLHSDLTDNDMTPKQLNACKTYEHAEVPDGQLYYWTKETKAKVIAAIGELRNYGKKLQKRKIAKGEKAIKLADKLDGLINAPHVRYNGDFQARFLKTLSQHKQLFATCREYEKILLNIAVCVVSGFAPYLAFACYNKIHTGKFGIFRNKPTATTKHVENIRQLFKLKPSRIKNELERCADDPNSKLHRFFGYKEDGTPLNPLNERKLLSMIDGFATGEDIKTTLSLTKNRK